MVVAGEPSGDLLAAELVAALRSEFAAVPPVPTNDLQPLTTSLEPRFFGAGGPRMAAAGVELAFDLTRHSVTGLSAVFRKLLTFQKLIHQLYRLARQREPDVIICVDFGAFNGRLAHLIRKFITPRRDWFHDWRPRIVQFVSPQVWGSRPWRAQRIAEDYDLVLSIIPFEKSWYARRAPSLHVEFVGHPIRDRYAPRLSTLQAPRTDSRSLLLLPGSRPGELMHHLPAMVGAFSISQKTFPDLRAQIVLPNETLADLARQHGLAGAVPLQVGGLAEALANTTVAIASTGTVTLECAYFGVPTVAMYKTSWFTYQIGKRLAQVHFMAMPNLLANEEVFPEFIQDAATPDTLAKAATDLLREPERRARMQTKLAEIIPLLGARGAPVRAAKAIMQLLASSTAIGARPSSAAATLATKRA
jgi:lipid-A-disaccharide synthase